MMFLDVAPPETSSEKLTEVEVDNVGPLLKKFAVMQSQVTRSYMELMDAMKTRWNTSGSSDVLSREIVAKKTREDLLAMQEQLLKYQNSIIMYQTDINTLWQTMIQHQQTLNNDFNWDFIVSCAHFISTSLNQN